MSLGCALANLFEIGNRRADRKRPGCRLCSTAFPPNPCRSSATLPTVFYDDEESRLLVAAVPGEDRFGYFGYLKKMVLTLHNIIMMKRGRLPFHGAMVHILLKSGRSANVLIIGDTGRRQIGVPGSAAHPGR